MKKILLSAALFTVGLASAQSDQVKFGVKAGLNVSNWTQDANTDSKIGGYIGGLVDLPLAGNFHLQPELLFQHEGVDGGELMYARVPIMAKYYIIQNLALQAGPVFGAKIGGDDTADAVTKSIDLQLAGGAAYEFAFGLFVDARFNAGFLDISDVPGAEFGTAVFQIGAGYRF